jgi:UDP-glucose 4-epimerase
MVGALIDRDNDIVGVDNLSTGKMARLAEAQRSERFEFVPLDLLRDDIAPALNGCDVVIHFAANPDVRQGLSNTRTHFDRNIEVTVKLLRP